MADLLFNGQTTQDEWTVVEDEQTIAGNSPAIVSWARWLDQKDDLLANCSSVGVAIPNDLDVATSGSALMDAALVSIDFPAFSDGRGYSQARLLRERFGYQGQIRATGDVLADQAFYMFRCGFDALIPRDDQDMAQMAASWKDFSLAYQPAACAPENMGWQGAA